MLNSLYPKYYFDMAAGDGGGGGGSDVEFPQDVVDMPPSIGGTTTTTTETGTTTTETVTTVTYTDTGVPVYTTTPKYPTPASGIYIINVIKGDFNPLYTSTETREYTIMGDVGCRFTLTISSSDGCDVFNSDGIITKGTGYIVTAIFPKVYEYTTYTFKLRVGAQTYLGGGMPKVEYIKEILQYINPTVTLSYATDDPYTTNCAYSGSDVTFTAKPLIEPTTYHTLSNKTYGKLTHAVAATITTGYLYIIKSPSISDYLLIDDREGLSTADLDKTLALGADETSKSGTIAVTESDSKKIITLTSTVQIEKVGKEDTVYELDIDSIITNIPQAFDQEVSTPKDTAVTIDIFKDINISTYLTAAITLNPKHGVLSGGFIASPEESVGTCTYTPPDLFQGVDEFEFEVTDGTNTSEDQYTVTINVGNISCG
jgi:hypothetical protein